VAAARTRRERTRPRQPRRDRRTGPAVGLPPAGRARDDLRALRRDPPDRFPSLPAEGKERLAGLTYSAFLLEVCGAHPDVERFYRSTSCPEWGYDTRALGAIDAWGTGYPGFAGLGLDTGKGLGVVPDLPAGQREALRAAVRVPLPHATVRVRGWDAWRRTGVRSDSVPAARADAAVTAAFRAVDELLGSG
jgi:hypothetical protein